MNCQDNSRLKVPLPELCKTTDIGCVPITSGKPDCPPEADQLPLAYDKDSQTLWLFDCESREWIAFGKFTLGELQEVSLDNIRNICQLLRIPVYYNPGGGTVQGSMPLSEFGEKLLSCIQLKGKVAILPTGNVSFSIQGLDSLEPFYTRWENLTVSGDGTSASPLVIKAETPIRNLPSASGEPRSTDKVVVVRDGQATLVDPPTKPCGYPKLTKAQVEAASDVLVIGCVDDKNVRIPYPENGANAETMTQVQIDRATGKWLLAVVDGKIYRIPFPKEPCEYTAKSAATIKNQTTSILACANGESSKIELSDLSSLILESGEVSFGSIAWPTIPTQCDPPTLAPTNNFPFQLDCDGNLWIWNATIRRWLRLTNADAPPGSDVPYYSSIAGKVNNPCNDILLRAWYLDKTDPGSDYKNAKITPTQLAGILDDCGLVSETEMANYFRGGFKATVYTMCHIGYILDPPFDYSTNCHGVGIGLKDIRLENYVACYAMHSQQFIWGSGTHTWGSRSGPYGVDPRTGQNVMGYITRSNVNGGKYTVTNPFDRPATVQVVCGTTLYGPSRYPTKFTVTSTVGVTTNPSINDHDFLFSCRDRIYNGINVGFHCNRSSPTGNMAVASSAQLHNQVAWVVPHSGGNKVSGTSALVYAPTPNYFTVPANGSIDLYMKWYLTWYAIRYYLPHAQYETSQMVTELSGPGCGANGHLVVTIFPS